MALNTTFTASILTTTQMNNMPFGIVTLATTTANSASSTTETAYLTSASFTAVTNRYYRLTYFEPAVQVTAGAGNYVFGKIRLTNATGTQYAGSQLQSSGATAVANGMLVSCVTLLTAGATVIVGTLQANTGTPTIFRGAGQPAYLMVEDLGSV
jgi:hypothetical protein